MGNYQWKLPSNAALQAARDLLACAEDMGVRLLVQIKIFSFRMMHICVE